MYQHDGTFSIVVKDNHYPSAAYCYATTIRFATSCPTGPYYVSQLDANLHVEWSFQNTTIDRSIPTAMSGASTRR